MKRLMAVLASCVTLLIGLAVMTTTPPAHAQTFTSCANVTQIPTTECEDLVTLYNSNNGLNWWNQTNWLTTNTPCSWYGISCSAGHVTQINLSYNQLSGSLPNFSNLPNLQRLTLSGNQLSGAIPNFSNLPNLLYLYLDSNQLSGTIPNFNLPNLSYLSLSTNQLSGAIPNFSNLSNLQWLHLEGNQLSGTIPNFSNLPNLRKLRLNHNQLSGAIPNFSNLPNLQWLTLDNNQLNGAIPNFSNLPNLQLLYLNNNQLSGPIPDFSNLPNLQELLLIYNRLSGVIPNFSNLPNLQMLDLSYNQLSGVIPNFSNLPNLQQLDLNGNQLSGPIPDFSNVPNLLYLYLVNNRLSGPIPDFSNLPHLDTLDLRNNQLSGPIPDFSNVPNLLYLYLSNNRLSGPIPDFSNLPHLDMLRLSNNQLSGEIPNVNWASFLAGVAFNNNCGLVESDTTQATILNNKDPMWQQVNPFCPVLSATITGTETGMTYTAYPFTTTISPISATLPITYTWSPAPVSGQGTGHVSYIWANTGTYSMTVTARNMSGTVTATHWITITPLPNFVQIIALAFDNSVTSTGNLTPYYAETMEAIRQSTVNQPGKTVVILADLDQQDDTRILVVQQGLITRVEGLPGTNGTLQSNLQEYDMADGATLGRFLTWVLQNYAHDKVTFSFVGHGTALAPETNITNILGNKGIQPRQVYLSVPHKTGHPDFTDHHTNSVESVSLISPHDLATALNMATHQGADKFAVVDLVHCFSASIEEFYELKDYAETLIGSPNYAYMVPQGLGQVIATSQFNQTSAAMAANMIKQYNMTLAEQELDVYTGSHPRLFVAVDTSQLAAVKQTWDELSAELLRDFQKDKLLQAHKNSKKYDTTFCEPQDWSLDSVDDALVDMGDFALAIQQQFSTSGNISTATAKAQATIAAAIIATERLGGQPWFSPYVIKPTWDLGNPRYQGLALFANFVARQDNLDGKEYLSFQSYWYTNTQRADNPNPYQFISGQSNWAQVLNRYWEGQNYETDFCTPTFPNMSTKLTLAAAHESIVPVNLKTPIWITAVISHVQPAYNIQGIFFDLNSSDVTMLKPACDKLPVMISGGVVLTATSRSTCTSTGWAYILTSAPITRSGEIIKFPFYPIGLGQVTMTITKSQISDKTQLLDHQIVTSTLQVATKGGIMGAISCQGRATCPPLRLTLRDTLGKFITATDAITDYKFGNLAAGTYTVNYRNPVSPYLFLIATRTVTVTIGQTSTLTVRLWAGAIDNDADVDQRDWDILAVAILPGGNGAFDLNGDGKTDILDLILLDGNKGKADPYTDAPIVSPNRQGTEPLDLPDNPSMATLALHHLGTDLYGINVEQVDKPLAFIGLQLAVTGTVTDVIPQSKFVGGFLNWHQDGDKLYIVAATPENSSLLTSAEIFQVQLAGQAELAASNLIFKQTIFLPILLTQ